jgi:hypothetical protein
MAEHVCTVTPWGHRGPVSVLALAGLSRRPVKGVDRSELLVGEFEVEHVDVLRDPLRPASNP